LIEVLVTHHKPEVEPYLDFALESLMRNLEPKSDLHSDRPIKIRVISSTEINKGIVVKYPLVNFLIDLELNNATKKVNRFLDELNPDTKFTILMSNDVYLAHDAIRSMEVVADQLSYPFIQSPLSNNEYGSRYLSYTPYLKENYQIESMDLDKIRAHNPKHGILFRFPWVSFYCPWIPVELWNKLGRLDEKLDLSLNDLDFCFRAAKQHIPTYINCNAYAFHFGSKTIEQVEEREEEKRHLLTKFSLSELLSFTI
jgi:hypothetical protein